jgi:hypothetical protein
VTTTKREQFAPWLTDPDDPADVPACADEGAAAAALAAAHPELVDKSNDGPIKKLMDQLERVIQDAVGEKTGRDPQTQHIVRTIYEAINHLDKSEAAIRDLIESRLMDVAGINRMKVSEAVTAGANLAKEIAAIRHQHIKRAFRHLRDKLPSDI